MQITTRLEFDAGHRIPCHKSQCRNLHGHRYAMEITLSGDVIQQEGSSEQGMVMDFSDVKAIARQAVVDVWDHAFLVYQGDSAVREFLETLPDHKTVVMQRTWRPKPSASWTPYTRTPTAITCGWNGCACSRRPTAGRTRSGRSSRLFLRLGLSGEL